MRFGLITLLGVTLTAIAVGQEPQTQLQYPLTEREGPWLVHVASFRGDDAVNFANRLAEEVRTKHRLLSFVFAMEDQSAKQERETLRQQQLQAVGSDKAHGTNEQLKFRTVRVAKDYSVFVGNFRDMEEARMQAAKIKEFEPPTSIPAYGFHLYDEPTQKVRTDPTEIEKYGVFASRAPTQEVKGTKLRERQGNVYRQAFVSRNPLIVQKQPTPVRAPSNEIDPVWRALNLREKYSIFTCPKPWTLVVAVFEPPTEVRGAVNPTVMQASYSAQAYGRHLEHCAEQARQLAELLRDGGRGYDAYVMHTQSWSLVAVGAFDSRTDKNMEQAYNALAAFAGTQEKGPFAVLKKAPQPMPVPGK